MSLTVRTILSLVIGVTSYGIVLFTAAGTYRWPSAWCFLLLSFLCSGAIAISLFRRDPQLLKERMRTFNQPGQPLWDKVFLLMFWALWIGWMVLMGFDAVRYQWTAIGPALQFVGGVGFVVANAGMYWIFRENTFLAPVVRLQPERGQTVVSTGPYAIVRHPMYTTAFLYVFSMAMLLGSGIGCVGAVLLVISLVIRTIGEDRMLRRELTGYIEYSQRVRYMLIPYVW